MRPRRRTPERGPTQGQGPAPLGRLGGGRPARSYLRPAAPAGGEVELHPEAEHHHRNVQGGAARAAVFGVSDGLVTNISLILGVVGAHPGPSYVRLVGLAGLLAGAFSMAAGEYVSMSAQRELLARELEVERRALSLEPEAELEELTQLYQRRGMSREAASKLAQMMMRTPEMALEAHAREEIGVDPSSIASPYPAAISSFASFSVGALIPLFPWFFTSGMTAVALSIGTVAIATVVVGLLLAQATGRSALRSAVRQLAVSMLAAGVTYLVGRFIGVNVAH
ncbi:MAG: VIT1/CCC1 transporter family protein [Acidimicrobiales bacterium]